MGYLLIGLLVTGITGFVVGVVIGYCWGASEPKPKQTGQAAPKPTETEKTLLERQIDEIMKQW